MALIVGVSIAALGLKKALAARKEAMTNEAQALESQANEAQMRQRAETEKLVARRQAYASDMNLAQAVLEANNLGRALNLLERHRFMIFTRFRLIKVSPRSFSTKPILTISTPSTARRTANCS
jgi:aspartyl-tRNA synthetase